MRTVLALLLAALTGTVLTGTLLTAPTQASQTSRAAETVKVIRWSDGDTVVTTAGRVRLIGIDTPEVGKCGYRAATRVANRLAPPGSTVRLIRPRGGESTDGTRLLRYVESAGRDIGAVQIRRGAWAAFDGRDGYQRHPRQDRYRRLDRQHANYNCGTQPSPSVPPINGGQCPSHAPIKGNRESMIYHRPGQTYYAITRAEECFRDAASAEAAGYRPARV
jgi:endonuclease YncB( thermonuclease family)